MTGDKGTSVSGRRRRLLTPAEKYQVWLEVVTGQGTQREIADKWRVNRSTVVQVVKTAKEGALDRLAAGRRGRGGTTAEQVALEDAQAEIIRLRDTITAQAVELHLHRGKESWG